MVHIFILKLQSNKYYVGKTYNSKFQICDHSLRGWTRKYSPIQIINIILNCNYYDEDKYTIKYMNKYGIKNVRGGSFKAMTLSTSDIKTIRRMINFDKCYKCGQKNHLIRNCDMVEVWQCDYCHKNFFTEKNCKKHVKHNHI